MLEVVHPVLLRFIEGTCDVLGVAGGRNLLGQAEAGTAEDFPHGKLMVKGFLGVAFHEALYFLGNPAAVKGLILRQFIQHVLVKWLQDAGNVLANVRGG